MGTPLVIGATVDANNFKFGTQLRFVIQTMFRIKLGRVWTRGASKKIGTPYLLMQPLKLATSNLAQDLRFGLAYQ